MVDIAGNFLPGWPQSIDLNSSGNLTQTGPTVGDLDGDNKPEIIAVTGEGLYIWHADGRLLPGWPRKIGQFSGHMSQIAVDDFDDDGINEILQASRRDIHITKLDGRSVFGWPRILSNESEYHSLAVGDIDKDNKKEIVVVDRMLPTKILVYKNNGDVYQGWPLVSDTTLGEFSTETALADLDNDQDLEIIVGLSSGQVIVYHHDGTILSGWPQSATTSSSITAVSIGDVDGDAIAEIVAGDNQDYLYVWRNNGQLLSGWPIKPQGMKMMGNKGFWGISIADIDGDEKADIIADSTYLYPVQAYNYDGSTVLGFPKPALMFGAGTPAIADLDGDGLLEMAWIDIDINVAVWDLPGKVTKTSFEWPMYGHDEKHTRVYSYQATRSANPKAKFDLNNDGLIDKNDSNYFISTYFHNDSTLDFNSDFLTDILDFNFLKKAIRGN